MPKPAGPPPPPTVPPPTRAMRPPPPHPLPTTTTTTRNAPPMPPPPPPPSSLPPPTSTTTTAFSDVFAGPRSAGSRRRRRRSKSPFWRADPPPGRSASAGSHASEPRARANDGSDVDSATPPKKKSQRAREREHDINLVATDMPPYEPLLDPYLTDYFSCERVRNHLVHLGLVEVDGRLVSPHEFKYNQIRLDREQYEKRILKSQEERDLGRDIEVAIRRQMQEDSTPAAMKLRRLKKPTAAAPPEYPDFLSTYPTTMWQTALLYAKKPACMASAERKLFEQMKRRAASAAQRPPPPPASTPAPPRPKTARPATAASRTPTAVAAATALAEGRRPSSSAAAVPTASGEDAAVGAGAIVAAVLDDASSALHAAAGPPLPFAGSSGSRRASRTAVRQASTVAASVGSLFDAARAACERGDAGTAEACMTQMIKETQTDAEAAASGDVLDDVDAQEVAERVGYKLRRNEVLLLAYVGRLGGNVQKIVEQLSLSRSAESSVVRLSQPTPSGMSTRSSHPSLTSKVANILDPPDQLDPVEDVLPTGSAHGSAPLAGFDWDEEFARGAHYDNGDAATEGAAYVEDFSMFDEPLPQQQPDSDYGSGALADVFDDGAIRTDYDGGGGGGTDPFQPPAAGASEATLNWERAGSSRRSSARHSGRGAAASGGSGSVASTSRAVSVATAATGSRAGGAHESLASPSSPSMRESEAASRSSGMRSASVASSSSSRSLERAPSSVAGDGDGGVSSGDERTPSSRRSSESSRQSRGKASEVSTSSGRSSRSARKSVLSADGGSGLRISEGGSQRQSIRSAASLRGPERSRDSLQRGSRSVGEAQPTEISRSTSRSASHSLSAVTPQNDFQAQEGRRFSREEGRKASPRHGSQFEPAPAGGDPSPALRLRSRDSVAAPDDFFDSAIVHSSRQRSLVTGDDEGASQFVGELGVTEEQRREAATTLPAQSGPARATSKEVLSRNASATASSHEISNTQAGSSRQSSARSRSDRPSQRNTGPSASLERTSVDNSLPIAGQYTVHPDANEQAEQLQRESSSSPAVGSPGSSTERPTVLQQPQPQSPTDPRHDFPQPLAQDPLNYSQNDFLQAEEIAAQQLSSSFGELYSQTFKLSSVGGNSAQRSVQASIRGSAASKSQLSSRRSLRVSASHDTQTKGAPQEASDAQETGPTNPAAAGQSTASREHSVGGQAPPSDIQLSRPGSGSGSSTNRSGSQTISNQSLRSKSETLSLTPALDHTTAEGFGHDVAEKFSRQSSSRHFTPNLSAALLPNGVDGQCGPAPDEKPPRETSASASPSHTSRQASRAAAAAHEIPLPQSRSGSSATVLVAQTGDSPRLSTPNVSKGFSTSSLPAERKVESQSQSEESGPIISHDKASSLHLGSASVAADQLSRQDQVGENAVSSVQSDPTAETSAIDTLSLSSRTALTGNERRGSKPVGSTSQLGSRASLSQSVQSSSKEKGDESSFKSLGGSNSKIAPSGENIASKRPDASTGHDLGSADDVKSIKTRMEANTSTDASFDDHERTSTKVGTRTQSAANISSSPLEIVDRRNEGSKAGSGRSPSREETVQAENSAVASASRAPSEAFASQIHSKQSSLAGFAQRDGSVRNSSLSGTGINPVKTVEGTALDQPRSPVHRSTNMITDGNSHRDQKGASRQSSAGSVEHLESAVPTEDSRSKVASLPLSVKNSAEIISRRSNEEVERGHDNSVQETLSSNLGKADSNAGLKSPLGAQLRDQGGDAGGADHDHTSPSQSSHWRGAGEEPTGRPSTRNSTSMIAGADPKIAEESDEAERQYSAVVPPTRPGSMIDGHHVDRDTQHMDLASHLRDSSFAMHTLLSAAPSLPGDLPGETGLAEDLGSETPSQQTSHHSKAASQHILSSQSRLTFDQGLSSDARPPTQPSSRRSSVRTTSSRNDSAFTHSRGLDEMQRGIPSRLSVKEPPPELNKERRISFDETAPAQSAERLAGTTDGLAADVVTTADNSGTPIEHPTVESTRSLKESQALLAKRTESIPLQLDREELQPTGRSATELKSKGSASQPDLGSSRSRATQSHSGTPKPGPSSVTVRSSASLLVRSATASTRQLDSGGKERGSESKDGELSTGTKQASRRSSGAVPSESFGSPTQLEQDGAPGFAASSSTLSAQGVRDAHNSPATADQQPEKSSTVDLVGGNGEAAGEMNSTSRESVNEPNTNTSGRVLGIETQATRKSESWQMRSASIRQESMRGDSEVAAKVAAGSDSSLPNDTVVARAEPTARRMSQPEQSREVPEQLTSAFARSAGSLRPDSAVISGPPGPEDTYTDATTAPSQGLSPAPSNKAIPQSKDESQAGVEPSSDINYANESDPIFAEVTNPADNNAKAPSTRGSVALVRGATQSISEGLPTDFEDGVSSSALRMAEAPTSLQDSLLPEEETTMVRNVSAVGDMAGSTPHVWLPMLPSSNVDVWPRVDSSEGEKGSTAEMTVVTVVATSTARTDSVKVDEMGAEVVEESKVPSRGTSVTATAAQPPITETIGSGEENATAHTVVSPDTAGAYLVSSRGEAAGANSDDAQQVDADPKSSHVSTSETENEGKISREGESLDEGKIPPEEVTAVSVKGRLQSLTAIALAKALPASTPEIVTSKADIFAATAGLAFGDDDLVGRQQSAATTEPKQDNGQPSTHTSQTLMDSSGYRRTSESSGAQTLQTSQTIAAAGARAAVPASESVKRSGTPSISGRSLRASASRIHSTAASVQSAASKAATPRAQSTADAVPAADGSSRNGSASDGTGVAPSAFNGRVASVKDSRDTTIVSADDGAKTIAQRSQSLAADGGFPMLASDETAAAESLSSLRGVSHAGGEAAGSPVAGESKRKLAAGTPIMAKSTSATPRAAVSAAASRSGSVRGGSGGGGTPVRPRSRATSIRASRTIAEPVATSASQFLLATPPSAELDGAGASPAVKAVLSGTEDGGVAITNTATKRVGSGSATPRRSATVGEKFAIEQSIGGGRHRTSMPVLSSQGRPGAVVEQTMMVDAPRLRSRQGSHGSGGRASRPATPDARKSSRTSSLSRDDAGPVGSGGSGVVGSWKNSKRGSVNGVGQDGGGERMRSRAPSATSTSSNALPQSASTASLSRKPTAPHDDRAASPKQLPGSMGAKGAEPELPPKISRTASRASSSFSPLPSPLIIGARSALAGSLASTLAGGEKSGNAVADSDWQ